MEGHAMNEKIKSLKQVYIDGANWQVFYIDELNEEKWVKEYPESEYHGGGTPQLKEIDFFPWEIDKKGDPGNLSE